MNRASDVVRAFLRGGGTTPADTPAAPADEQLAMESLALLAERYERRYTRVTPVATTPRTALRARRSDAVLRELIAGAREELIVLGYEISDVDIIGALAERASLGVAVDLLVDGVQTPVERLAGAWPLGAGRARVWTTGHDDRGRPYRLHAKALIADGRRCMLGSANLTYSGLHTNLELGALIEGSVARRFRSHVREMVQRGVVVPARWLGDGANDQASAAT